MTTKLPNWQDREPTPVPLALKSNEWLGGNAQTVESLLVELAQVAEVCVHRMDNGCWWVTVKPNKHAPLWWYADRKTLIESLKACRKDAVEMRFLAA
jgi:hypothetical protein